MTAGTLVARRRAADRAAFGRVAAGARRRHQLCAVLRARAAAQRGRPAHAAHAGRGQRTTLCAFGMLALSRIAVLQVIGVTVLPRRRLQPRPLRAALARARAAAGLTAAAPCARCPCRVDDDQCLRRRHRRRVARVAGRYERIARRTISSPRRALATWIGRVDAVDASPLPAAFADYDCRNNRLAQLAARTGRLQRRRARGRATPWRRAHRRLPRHHHVGHPRHRTRVSRDRPATRRRTAMCCPRALPLPAQPVRDDRIRARLPRVPRARGDGFDRLLVEREGVRGGRARDRRRRLRRRDRRRRGFARAVHAVRISFAGVAVPAALPACAIDRDGISIGEAAGFALLDPDAGADVHLLGAGESSDAHHMSSPHPEGAGAARAMRAALARRTSATEPAIDYVNLHGTASRPNDAAEDRAVFSVFGAATPVSSTKGWTGHTLGRRGNHGRADRRTCAEAAVDSGHAELRARRSGARLAPSCSLRSRAACGMCCATPSASAAPTAASCWESRRDAARHCRHRRLRDGHGGLDAGADRIAGRRGDAAASRCPASRRSAFRRSNVAARMRRRGSPSARRRRRSPACRRTTCRAWPRYSAPSDGDGEVLASMLAALAQPQVVLSPTLFHNSVFNAPAGYWSIGAGAHAASITVSAGAASFVAGLKEAHWQVLATGAPVLYVAFDAPFPAALASFERSAEPFACALCLRPGDSGTVRLHRSVDRPIPQPRKATTCHLQNCWRDSPATPPRPRCRCCEPLRTGGPPAVALPYLDGVEPVARLPAVTADRARIEALIPQQGRDVPARPRGFLGRATYHLLHDATPCRDQSAAHGHWTFVAARHRIRGAGDGRAWRAHGAGRGAAARGAVAERAGLRVLLSAAGRHRGTARSSKRANGHQ